MKLENIIENNTGHDRDFGYLIMCDNPNLEASERDLWFEIYEYDMMRKKLEDFTNKGYKFDLVFDEVYEGEIVNRIWIIENNYENN